MILALFPTQEAAAKPPSVNVIANSDLRFGAFGVLSTGTRTISPAGAVTNLGILPVPGSPTGPAEFSIVYDRGNQSHTPLSLVIEVTLLGVPQVSSGGVTGTLSDFTTDLPGAATLMPGQVVRIAIDNCLMTLCTTTFRVGGKLQVQRSSGGGNLNFPLPVSATVIEVNGRAP